MEVRAPRPSGSRKRRTREHVIADLSVNFLERFILRCGYTADPITKSDYGLDLMLFAYSPEGEIENGQVLFQLKATDRLPLLADGRTISFPVEVAHLWHWEAEPYPIILVVYDASR